MEHRSSRASQKEGDDASSTKKRSGRALETEAASPTKLSESVPSADSGDEAPKRRCGRAVDNLSQQKLRAWQPVLTPKGIMVTFFIVGFVFVGLGIALLLASNSVKECQVEYDDPDSACSDINACTTPFTLTVTAEDCLGIGSDDTIEGPVFVYYRLKKYYQNHRRYVKSRSDSQLRGQLLSESDLSSCDPLIMDSGNPSRILSPCGLIAWSLFNDTIRIMEDPTTPYPMDDSAETIAWSGDIGLFKNPENADPAVYNEWLNDSIFPGKVENGHFMVWMRVAALPDFRKLYGKISESVTLPLTIEVDSRYPVSSFGGRKFVVLTQTSWVGGRNPFLGIAYIVVGSICIALGIFFVVKNYRKPRLVGDVRHLNYVFSKTRK